MPRTTRRRTTAARGYDGKHKAERRWYEDKLRGGAAFRCVCNRSDCPHHEGQCNVVITAATPSTDYDLGHTPDRTAWAGLECVPCNRSAGARNSRASLLDPMTIREWPSPPRS